MQNSEHALIKSFMRVLVTGNTGYIGSLLTPLLEERGHEVVGMDARFFADCLFGRGAEAGRREPPVDVRDAAGEHLRGMDAVIHLAALSNDPLGNLNSDLTYEINHRASVRLAALARDTGVPRFLFASSCSLYGVADAGDMLDEEAPFNPVTPYGESKIMVERDVSSLARDDFSPTFLRNATAYGVSPRLRLDLVVNDLVARAISTGEVMVLSDGTPWRPLVHVEDIARAFIAALEAPRERVHNQAFNVGRTDENYRVSEVAELVAAGVPGSRVRYAEDGGPDPRSYRVDCSRIETALPGFDPVWTVPRGVEQLREAFESAGLGQADLESDRFVRLRRIRTLQARGLIDEDLRWREATPATHHAYEGSPDE